MKELTIGQMFMGHTDAKNEVINFSIDEVERFRDGFLMPENINVDDFLDGNRFFITGLKGTGKTALLRYLAIEAKNKYSANEVFVLFKSDIRKESKDRMLKLASDAIVCEKNDNYDLNLDLELVWWLFFHRHIVRIMENQTCGAIIKDSHWDEYYNCVNSIEPSNGNSIFKLFPKIKGGKIALGKPSNSDTSSSLEIDFEWRNPSVVKFTNLVEKANQLFQNLTAGSGRIYIFIDELELSFGSKDSYNKDICLIRDIIRVIYEFNILAKKNNINLFLVTGIRSEVVKATESCGKEINKPIADFGVNLRWQQPSEDCNHPLLRIINKKIQASELKSGMVVTSDDEIFKKYFPAQISQLPISEYILQQTWYRPRDIVRLLGLIKQQYPNEKRFSQKMFESIRKEYSTQCWVEQMEELNASYSKEEIEGIKMILLGLKCPFYLHEIKQKVDQLSEFYEGVSMLNQSKRIMDVLNNLFRIGIVGNVGSLVRYSYRGDDSLLMSRPMAVHYSLWSYLSITKRKNLKKNKNYD